MTLSPAALAAKELRSRLKAAFPGTKFSLKSHYFAGGSAISISWVLGPALHTIEEMAAPFLSGRYDPSTDTYIYFKFRDMPSVKYIDCTRRSA